jgi:hypothetical protein
MAAATIAAAVTILSAPSAKVFAGPMAKPITEAMTACAARPWLYLHCVGTRFGNPRIRLLSTERLGAGEDRRPQR